MTYAEAIDFLYNLEHGSVKLGLERIEAATEALDHPERRYLNVHVAGTNGKGSTCAFVAAALEAAGYRTGLLTSPHLLAFGERIRVGGRMLAEETVAALTAELRPMILAEKLSYFEATTALAFEAFARAGVEAAVLEVGMGGRLDATNVVRPVLTIVTGIDLDHTKSLGATREQIAGEKAGIMKPGVPMLVAEAPASVREVFDARGGRIDAPVVHLAQRAALESWAPDAGGTSVAFRRADGTRGADRIGLAGEHQARNALLSRVACELLSERRTKVAPEAIARGLAVARWPGRFQILPGDGRRPVVVLDVAHNPSGAETVCATYAAWMNALPEPTLLVGMLADKDHGAFLGGLRPLSERLHLIPLEGPRTGPVEDVATAARGAGFAPRVHASLDEAWTEVAAVGRPIVACGSFRTVEAVMLHLGLGPEPNLYPLGEPV